MSGSLESVSQEDFKKEVLEAPMPVLVDFWAPWCGPCKMITPLLEKVAVDEAARLKVCKVNVDDCPDIAAQYSVRGIPSLLLLRAGEVIATKVGALTQPQLQAFLDENL